MTLNMNLITCICKLDNWRLFLSEQATKLRRDYFPRLIFSRLIAHFRGFAAPSLARTERNRQLHRLVHLWIRRTAVLKTSVWFWSWMEVRANTSWHSLTSACIELRAFLDKTLIPNLNRCKHLSSLHIHVRSSLHFHSCLFDEEAGLHATDRNLQFEI